LSKLCFTVTNDLVYDQRMIRICTSLQQKGHEVTLIGREGSVSPGLLPRTFNQIRLRCLIKSGPLSYAEYNARLFIFLLFRSWDLVCAIDLDTILPCWLASGLKRKKRVYDAHELFCEMKEVVSRPAIYRIWKAIERFTVPRFPDGYTVSLPIAEIFKKEYGVEYPVIRNLSRSNPFPESSGNGGFIIYQGAVNEGRSFETLIPAMQWVDLPLHIYGDGNFLEQAKAMVNLLGLEQKIIFKGKMAPDELATMTPRARAGITLFENKGLSNYYSMANRFFDYIQAGVPQVCVDFPAYREINELHEVALLVDDLSPKHLAEALNKLIHDEVLYKRLRDHCRSAAAVLNWGVEETALLNFYDRILN